MRQERGEERLRVILTAETRLERLAEDQGSVRPAKPIYARKFDAVHDGAHAMTHRYPRVTPFG
jgi:hypothetical protein